MRASYPLAVLLLGCAVLWSQPVWAQAEPKDTQRAQIARQRQTLLDRRAAEQKLCSDRLLRNACLQEAKSRYADELADLRRQEISLDDAQRRRLSAQRLKDVQGKQTRLDDRSQSAKPGRNDPSLAQAQKQAAMDRNTELAQQRVKDGQARQLQHQQALDTRLAQSQDRVAKEKAYRVRQEQAHQHQSELASRSARAGASSARPLPVPP